MTGVGEEGGKQWIFFFDAGVKVASSKEGEGGVKDVRLRDARSSGGHFFWSLLKVKGSQGEVLWALLIHASLERRYVHAKNCPPLAAAMLLWVPCFISCFPTNRL